MSELISGKEAFVAYMDGNEVEWNYIGGVWKDWTGTTSWSKDALNNQAYQFRIKPKTITLNGVEIPAPFEPKDGELFYYINSSSEVGYSEGHTTKWSKYSQFGAWRKEEEVKQVVEVLRGWVNGKS